MSNPFDAVYNGLWTMAETWPTISTLVKPGNRVKFDTDSIPTKSAIAFGDLPELILVPADTVINLGATSSSTYVAREYDWLISTGNYKLTNHMNEVEWALFITHLNWSPTLTSLLYQSKTYVKHVRLINARTGISDPDRNRGLQGWSSIWRVQVEMHFKTSDLKTELVP